MYLLDTNVVSELRKARPDRHVKRWADGVAASSLYLSAITVLELETGVLQVERRDARQGAALRHWMDDRVMPAFSGRVLAIDTLVAVRCARLHVPDRMAHGDALIAATALVHGLIVVTRNTVDFKPAAVELINPWEETAYLLRSPRNARRLLESMAQLESGGGKPRKLAR